MIDKDIVASVMLDHSSGSSLAATTSENEEETDETHALVSPKEAQEAVVNLRSVFKQQEEANFDLITQVDYASMLLTI